VGDAGEIELDSPTLAVLGQVVGNAPDRSLAVFLGDNIYPRGLPTATEPGVDLERQAAEQILREQVAATERAGIEAVFVPGNHDWDHSGRRGLERLQEQGSYLAAISGGDATLQPTPGCPGPMVLDLGERARLIAIDSEWLLRADHPKLTDCSWGAEGSQ
jgi:hypothetical protein